MYNTTLCYIENDNKYLMLHRVKKENDLNHDKWIGIGGKFEYGESPEECNAREVLEESLKNFNGTIIFMSHDRYFINKIATKIIAFENKQLKTYNGDYEYYLQQKKKGF